MLLLIVARGQREKPRQQVSLQSAEVGAGGAYLVCEDHKQASSSSG